MKRLLILSSLVLSSFLGMTTLMAEEEVVYSVDLADLYSVTFSYELFRDDTYNTQLWDSIIAESLALVKSIPHYPQFFDKLSQPSKIALFNADKDSGVFSSIGIFPSATSYYKQRSRTVTAPPLSSAVRTVQLSIVVTRAEDSDLDAWAAIFDYMKALIEELSSPEKTKEQKLDAIAQTAHAMFEHANQTAGFAGFVVIGASMDPSEYLTALSTTAQA